MGYGGYRRGGFRRDFGPREMTKIKCSECGKEAEVPFKPIEGRPVYCRECFMKKKGITPRESAPEASVAPAPAAKLASKPSAKKKEKVPAEEEAEELVEEVAEEEAEAAESDEEF